MSVKEPNTVALTLKGIKALSPRIKPYFANTAEKGLKIRIEPSGEKSFYFYRKIKGNPKPYNKRLGDTDTMSIENALKSAAHYNNLIHMGVDPRKQEESERISGLTFGEYFDRYINEWAKLKKKSWQVDLDQYRRHLKKPFGAKPIAAITRQDVVQFHLEKAESSGKHSANRIKALITVVLNHALSNQVITSSPANRIPNHRVDDRERFLDEEEFARIMAVIRGLTNITLRDYLLVSLYTGARQGNVLAMRWAHISLKASNPTWTIPANEFKGRGSFTIPLHKDIVTLLQTRFANYGDKPYVFPSNSATGHYVEPKNGWKSVCKNAKVEDFRMHDLRRTFGSYLTRSGMSLTLVGKALGHKSPRSTQVYAQLLPQDVKNAIDSTFKKYGDLFDISSINEIKSK